jgi:carbon monoxide dehydrogenase subunit G
VDINGEQRIPALQQTVWDALNDPEALKASIPGCESVDKVSDTQFTARITMAIGPVKAKFNGDVTLSEIDAPNGYTITGKGSGGAAGFGKGSARVTLTPDGNTTVLRYAAQASVGGKLAQIGQRLVDSAARKMADEFFTNFTAYLTAKGAAAPEPAVAAASPAEASVGEQAATAAPAATVSNDNKKMSPVVWVGVAAVVAALLIWFLTR